MITEKHISIHAKTKERKVPLTNVHSLVLGSSASSLNAAAQLRIQDMENVMILTEGYSILKKRWNSQRQQAV